MNRRRKRRSARMFSPTFWRRGESRDWNFIVELEDGPDAGRTVEVKIDINTARMVRENLNAVLED